MSTPRRGARCGAAAYLASCRGPRRRGKPEARHRSAPATARSRGAGRARVSAGRLQPAAPGFPPRLEGARRACAGGPSKRRPRSLIGTRFFDCLTIGLTSAPISPIACLGASQVEYEYRHVLMHCCHIAASLLPHPAPRRQTAGALTLLLCRNSRVPRLQPNFPAAAAAPPWAVACTTTMIPLIADLLARQMSAPAPAVVVRARPHSLRLSLSRAPHAPHAPRPQPRK